MVFFGSTVFMVPAAYLAALIVGFASWITGRHDFKSERMAVLASRLGKQDYDVVLLQELYGTWYADGHRTRLVKAMADNGYGHFAMPSAVSALPSCWANSGLAIFSRHPLSDVKHHLFTHQTIYDRLAVNRGVIGATVHLPGGSGLARVYGTHFGPPLSVLEEVQSATPYWLQRLVDVYPQQVGDIVSIIKADAARAGVATPPLFLAGDFNAPVLSEPYDLLCRELKNELCLDNLAAELLEAKDAPCTTNPPGERLLTGGKRTQHILDYAFADRRKFAVDECSICPQRLQGLMPDGKPWPFQFISDHLAVSVRASVLTATAGGEQQCQQQGSERRRKR